MEVFSAGLALAFSVLVSFVATAYKLPPWVKAWLIRHRLVTDIVVFLGITAFLTFISKSVISLIASTMATLAVSLGLEGLVWWEKKRLENGLPPMFGEANPIVKPAKAPEPQGIRPERPMTLGRVLRAVFTSLTRPQPAR